MIDWLAGFVPFFKGLIPHFKGLHLGMLILWCAGLFSLPLMLSRHDPAVAEVDYSRIRKATHYSYIYVVTPAAVLAIASGTALIFLREVYVTWMIAKLAFVGLLVFFHVWVGYVLTGITETHDQSRPPDPRIPLVLLLVPIMAILTLVLAKPDLGTIPMPEWLLTPRGNQLPFDVPRR
ncbi:MAG: CopD family protein [Sulfitobacter sp.]|nr:CopD family protein [Sulfitobacter sp.]